MLKECLTFYGDYYTLNRKVTVIEHKCADPNLVLIERSKRKLLNQQKESGEESEISDPESPPVVDLTSGKYSDTINTQSNPSNPPISENISHSNNLIPMN